MSSTLRDIIGPLLRDPDDPACELTDREVGVLNSLPVDEATSLLVDLVYQNLDDRALKALLEIERFDRVAFLIELFDAPPFASWAAGLCQDLADFPDRRIVKKLGEIIRTHPDPDVRACSMESLVAVLHWLRDDSARAVLQWSAQHEEGADYEGRPLKEIALWALERVSDDWQSGPPPQERAREVYYQPDGSVAERYHPKLWPIPA